ncbi:MAG: ArsR family transcriptional regulator [Terracidiphilus sp.]
MAKTSPTDIDRDQQILSRLSRIEHRVDSIDQTQAFALRADDAKHSNTVKEIFKTGTRRAQVYLAADGTRGVDEIAKHLKMKRPNVSRELKVLFEEGMLEIADATGRRDIWGRKAIDRTLRISAYLRREYGLAPDGREASAAKSKARSKK